MNDIIWIQKIFFGPPGCGKSFEVRREAEEHLGIVGKNSPYLIETTFHPEYGYGDFLAKLLPYSCSRRQEFQISFPGNIADGAALKELVDSPKIEYRIHTGPLLRALAGAYAQSEHHVLLVIDEINRGNCAQIFGDAFQLLDRDEHGWSEYGIELSDLFQAALEQELARFGKSLADLPQELRTEHGSGVTFKLRFPPNLSLIGTMNTSDESIYYMDTAFKRRWDFSYIPWHGNADTVVHQLHCETVIEGTTHTWRDFLEHLNGFIARRFAGRNVDDKQVGLWFLKGSPGLAQAGRLVALLDRLEQLEGVEEHDKWAEVFTSATRFDKSTNLATKSVKTDFESYGVKWPDFVHSKPERLAETLIEAIEAHLDDNPLQIRRDAVRNKLMFFLWDNVFARDRTPLATLVLRADETVPMPRTFGEFAAEHNVDAFINAIMDPEIESDAA
jgi:5-methylcytosine-specific restriction enzyme B